jgi:glycosyltransferase involved in cell wall biosynthesis
MKMLRVLHLTAGSDAGGLSRYILNLSTAMTALGHSVWVAGGRGAWHEQFVAAGVDWLDVPLAGGPLALRRAGRHIARELATRPADVIHTHYRKSTLVARQVQRIHQRQTGQTIPILYTLHMPRIPMRGPLRWISDFGDHIHVPSRMARDWLLSKLPIAPDRVTLIPHGVNVDRFPQRMPEQFAAARTALGLPPDASVAVFIGRLDIHKNADWMVDVAEASPQTIILVAGDGPYRAWTQRQIDDAGLEDRVMLLGDCNPLPIYQAADALLVPSSREGFNFAAAEAMSVGVPVLRTRTGGAAEQIIEGVTGQSVEPDRAAFARAAAAFLADRAALARMGPRAAEHARAGLSFTQQLDRTLALYDRLATPALASGPTDRIVPA